MGMNCLYCGIALDTDHLDAYRQLNWAYCCSERCYLFAKQANDALEPPDDTLPEDEPTDGQTAYWDGVWGRLKKKLTGKLAS